MQQIVKSIRKGHCIGMVADQKSNEGGGPPVLWPRRNDHHRPGVAGASL